MPKLEGGAEIWEMPRFKLLFYLCTPPGRWPVTAEGSERAGRAGCIVFFPIWYKVHIIGHIIDKWKPHFVHQKLLCYYSIIATFSTLGVTTV